ncbi:uncharacterized protein LOC143148358 [Ptiloglossa arizonensis]|uniref:uncharacterized protein LOC143148358 n=1 Tax=Ptiloglossa arizonensis TaxID=3350558 RepID=UPI003FA08643
MPSCFEEAATSRSERCTRRTTASATFAIVYRAATVRTSVVVVVVAGGGSESLCQLTRTLRPSGQRTLSAGGGGGGSTRGGSGRTPMEDPATVRITNLGPRAPSSPAQVGVTKTVPCQRRKIHSMNFRTTNPRRNVLNEAGRASSRTKPSK